EDRRIARVPAVREHDHDRVAVQEPRPPEVEGAEALADLRSARPLPDVAEPGQGPPVRRVTQILGDPVKPGREDERLHPAEVVLHRIQKLEEQATVEVHRAGHVAEDDELRLLDLPLTPGEVDQLAARERKADRATEIDATASPRWLEPPAPTGGEPPGDLGG